MSKIKTFSFTDSEFEKVKLIRSTVFINEQGAAADEEFDMYDRDALFALLFDEKDKIVGTARLVKTDTGLKIGRIAILSEYRGKGYGAEIVSFMVENAFEKGADFVFVDAQSYAVSFYEKIGFRVIGNEIFDRGLPHIPMRLEKEIYYGTEKKE